MGTVTYYCNYLPEAKLARTLPKSTGPASVESSPAQAEPIQLAQAQPSGVDAALAEADAKWDAGNLADAYLGYLGVLNDYPQALLPAVIDARDRIKDMTKTLDEAGFQALNAVAADWTTLHGPLAVRGTNEFYRAWADACKERGDLDGWAWRTQEVMARTMWGILRYPNDLDTRRLFSWYLTAANDLDMHREGEKELQEFLLKQEPSVITFEGWARLANNAAQHQDAGQRIIYAANALGSADTLGTVLNNPAELQKEKAELAYRLGEMYEDVGMLDEALAQFQDMQTRYPVPESLARNGNAVYDAGIRAAQMIARQNSNDLNQGVLAYNDFIQRYPNGPLVSQARFEMAGLYILAGDYRQGAQLYQRLVQDDPGQAEQVWRELDFVLTYLYDSVEVASGEPVADAEDVKVAQMCGPSALQKLLKSQGVDVAKEELATLAGTDETGTTMLGLVEAAKAKGIELAGVEAPEAEGLPQPFIAYVNHNHFLVVREVRPDAVVVLDMDKPEAALTRAEFARMWDGKALIRADASSQVAQALNPEAQKGAKGGCDGSPTPEDPPPCESDGLCPCPEDNGAGNPPPPLKPPHRVCTSGGCSPGSPQCPSAESGVRSPGVNPRLYPSSTMFKMQETDVSVPVRGQNGLTFQRILVNEKGYYRPRYTDNTKPWSNNLGKGWTHGFNMHLVTSTPISGKPTTVVLYDENGTDRAYVYSSTASGIHYYLRNSTGSSRERGNTLMLDSSTLKYTLVMPGGREYQFSAATDDIYRFARLEKIVDISGNELTLDYDGAVGTGKLTKVSPPTGDSRYLQLSYSGNLITKMELKKSAAVLQTTQYVYNASNELTKITDNASNDVLYAYGTYAYAPTSRFITTITDKAGRETDFTYTFGYSSGYQAYKVDQDNVAGLRTTYDRSMSTGVAAVTNTKGGSTHGKYVYTPVLGDMSRVQSLDYYHGNLTSYERWAYEYVAVTRALTKSIGAGRIVQQASHNDAGRLTNIQCCMAPCGAGTAGGGETNVHYETSTSLYPTRRTGPDGLDIYYYYDSYYRITKVTHPSVAAAGYQFSYDAYGQITTMTDPLSHATTLAYDAIGNVTSVTDPNSSTTTFYYDDYGNVTRTANPLNKDTYFYYSYGGCGACSGGGHQLTKVKDPLNNETEMQYDSNGDLTKTIDALDRETGYFYDEMNRLTSIESPSSSGIEMTFQYNLLGQLTATTDFDGKTISYAYDHLNRMTSETDSIGAVTYAYDAFDNMTSVTDAASHTTTYGYDYAGGGQLSAMTDAANKIVRYFYDSAGRMTKVGAGSNGTVDPTEYFYSASTGLMTKVRYSSGQVAYDADYAYDADGRITKLTDWIDGTDGLRYAYDGAGRLTRLTDYEVFPYDGLYLTYAYDAAGNVTSVADYYGNTTTYTYTDTSVVSTLTAPGNKTWTYTYNALGQPTQVSIPNGMTTVYSYDGRNRFTKIEQKVGSTVLDGFTYALTNGGHITKTTNADSSYWDYWYDGWDRLTKADRKTSEGSLLHRFTYTYDAGDNMLTKQVYDGGTTVSTAMAYDAANEISTSTAGGVATTFAFDAWGRLTNKTQANYSATYAYRYGHKLYSLTSNFPNEGDVSYEYGADGKRRSRAAGGTTTYYRWDVGWNIVNENNSDGTLTSTFTYDFGQPMGMMAADVAGSNPSTGTYRYYSQDNLGSTRRLRAQDTSSLGVYEYEPYGDIYNQSGVAFDTLPAAFAGKPFDSPAQLYFSPYRFYNPSRGQWSNRDPGDIRGLNLYSFVNNNPVIWVDPLGLWIFPHPIPIDPKSNSIVCKGGKLVVQNNNKGPDSKCTQVHEEQHLKDWKARWGDNLCKGVKDGYLKAGGIGYKEFLRQSECKAYEAGKKCRQDLLKRCKGTGDEAAIQEGINRDDRELKKNRCK